MDRERLAWLRVGAALGDGAALATSWWVLVDHRIGWVVVPLWIACLRAVGSYRSLRRKSGGEVAGEVARAALVGAVATAAALFALDARVSFGAWAAVSVPIVVAMRALHAGLLRVLRKRRFDPHRVLVVGDDAAIASWFENPAWGNERAATIGRDPAALAGLLATCAVDEVVVTGAFDAEVPPLAAICDEFGVPLTLDANFLGLRSRPELVERDGRTHLTFARIPRSETSLVLKRAMDLGVAAALLALTAPLAMAVAVAVRATSGGPVLFGQPRVGRFGRTFTLWKFRTMVNDAPALPVAEGRPAPKLRDDPRVTPIGRLLRRASLDELPQLWNVVRGEMSLVGPRPPLRAEVDRYERWQLRRLSMKPGLTGLWQVSGRADLPFERWMSLDLEYIDRWSLWLDLTVLARTLPAVVRGTGAR